METYYSTIALFLAVAVFFGGAWIWDQVKPQNAPSPPLPADAPAVESPQVTPVEDLFDGPEVDVWGADDIPGRGGADPTYHLYRPGPQ